MSKKKKKLIGTVIRSGICLKTDNEIIHSALFSKAKQLERVIERQKHSLSMNELKELQDEYERTFALTENYGRR